jgi:hypothetical protein
MLEGNCRFQLNITGVIHFSRALANCAVEDRAAR